MSHVWPGGRGRGKVCRHTENSGGRLSSNGGRLLRKAGVCCNPAAFPHSNSVAKCAEGEGHQKLMYMAVIYYACNRLLQYNENFICHLYDISNFNSLNPLIILVGREIQAYRQRIKRDSIW